VGHELARVVSNEDGVTSRGCDELPSRRQRELVDRPDIRSPEDGSDVDTCGCAYGLGSWCVRRCGAAGLKDVGVPGARLQCGGSIAHVCGYR
jgi:hypothetical protein